MSLPLYPVSRPKTRGECAGMPRPCPFVSCRYHLAHDWIKPKHGSAPNDDDVVDAIESAAETCALDVADRGPQTQRDTASVLGVTHTRVSQIESGVFDTVGYAASDVTYDSMDMLREADLSSYDPTLSAECE